MRLARCIFAILIGLSVATLPITGFAAPKQAAHDAMQMSAAEPMDDCCPHSSNPCGSPTDGCKSMAACALKCFNFTGGVASPFLYTSLLVSFVPAYDQVDRRGQAGIAPFRPPRI